MAVTPTTTTPADAGNTSLQNAETAANKTIETLAGLQAVSARLTEASSGFQAVTQAHQMGLQSVQKAFNGVRIQ